MKDKVSIIVPIYNVEKYIERGIKSLIAQTYKNIEIILVDDGSPDNSGKICDKCAKKDTRIKVIHKKNGGVSSARNVGLEKSTGKYIMFMDGDDYVEEDYVDYFVNLINKLDVLVAFNSSFFSIYTPNQNKKIENTIIDNTKAMEYIYLGKVNVAVWNKIYSRKFFDNDNIRFNEKIWYGEGMLFNIKILQFVKNVGLGNRKVYHQVYNTGSAMRKFNLESNYCGIKSLDLQKEKMINPTKEVLTAWSYHRRQFNVSILTGIIKNNLQDEYKEEYEKCIKNLKKDVSLPLKVDIPIKSKIVSILISINPKLFIGLKIKKEKLKVSKYGRLN